MPTLKLRSQVKITGQTGCRIVNVLDHVVSGVTDPFAANPEEGFIFLLIVQENVSRLLKDSW